MPPPKSNNRSQAVDMALGQSQMLLVGRSTSAGSKSPRLPQVPPLPTPCSPRAVSPGATARAAEEGVGPLKGAGGVVTRRGRRRGAGARSREDDVRSVRL